MGNAFVALIQSTVYFCRNSEAREASGHQGENEWQWKKKKKSEQEHMRYSLHKTCSNEVSESFTM